MKVYSTAIHQSATWKSVCEFVDIKKVPLNPSLVNTSLFIIISKVFISQYTAYKLMSLQFTFIPYASSGLATNQYNFCEVPDTHRH